MIAFALQNAGLERAFHTSAFRSVQLPKRGESIGSPRLTGNSWEHKKVSGHQINVFFELVAAYWDRLYCSIFYSLFAVVCGVLPHTVHNLLKSYPQKTKKKTCFFGFY